MKKRTVALGIAILWICCMSTLALETGSCTLDIPAEWGDSADISGAYDPEEYAGVESYFWQLETGENATLQLLEQDGANPFDLVSDEDLRDLEEGIQTGMMEDLNASFSAEDALAGVNPVLASGKIAREEWNGQPCFRYLCQVDLEQDGSNIGSLYLQELIFLTKTHSITLTATAYDAASAERMMGIMQDGFSITEDCYTEKTPGLFASIVKGAIVGGAAGLAVWVFYKVKDKSKKSAEEPDQWNPEL